MLGKTKAIGYTFLWAIAYGFMISVVLVIIFSLFISNNGMTEDMSNAEIFEKNGTMVIVSTLAAAIARIWLVYGTAYGYGLTDGLETCGKKPGE